jgi:hypothetical protein
VEEIRKKTGIALRILMVRFATDERLGVSS